MISCRPSTDEDIIPPAYILSEPVFVKVLTDCYLGEGAAGINVKNVIGEKFDSAYLFNPFKDNAISKTLFDTTIAYYSQHPKKLKLIYNKVLDNLSQIQALGILGKKHIAEPSEKYKNTNPAMYLLFSRVDSVSQSKKKSGFETAAPTLYKVSNDTINR